MSTENAPDPWDQTQGIDPDSIQSPNITPDVKIHEQKEYVWLVLKELMTKVDTIDELREAVDMWNKKNNPPIPGFELVKLTTWAIMNWDTKYNPKYQGS